MLEQERGEVAVLAEAEQVLLVQRVDVVLGVVVDDEVGDDQRPALVGRADAEEGEAAGQASDRAEERLERLGEVVADVVPGLVSTAPDR